MMLRKKGHHHYNRSGIALPEGMHLPDRREKAGKLVNKLLPADAVPVSISQPSKRLVKIFLDPVIVAVPNASACQQLLPLFDIDNAVLSSLLINVAEQGPVDLPQAIWRKVLKALFV